MIKKIQNNGFAYFLIFLGCLNICLSIFIGIKASDIQENLFSFGVLALFLGVIFESYRLTKSWEFVLFKFILAYTGSFMAFLPGKKEYVYHLETHLFLWPYYFLFFYLLLSVIFLEEKIIGKLSEGYTLLLSLSFLYWLIDLQLIQFSTWYYILLSSICIVFTLYSLANALLWIELNQKNKLWLSIWSTLILIVFGFDNFIQVYSKGDMEFSKESIENFTLGIQYFLLGISSVYVFHNSMLILDLLPDRSGNYRDKLKKSVKKHAKRYSDEQLETQNALFCMLFCGIIYSLNFYFDLFPRNILIWMVIISFPIIFHLFEHLLKRKLT
ncbi:hypothetical protein [Moheibacter stercoris]|uniref:Beta-carotene 15,15'-monooxygenase n=1 Tax=Moheibacter stercoris TaxID=1628251 RepID=A0ABV2LVQ5_9FLAO